MHEIYVLTSEQIMYMSYNNYDMSPGSQKIKQVFKMAGGS